MNLKDSKTKENLLRAFAGESQARNRYNISASVAKKEGLYIIESLFNYTADQEKSHAKQFFSKLQEFAGENISISGAYPVDLYDKTAQHLKAAQHNELQEWDDVYKNFGKTAREEGFESIAKLFENIAEIEKVHGDRFGRYATDLEEGTLFRRNEDIQWICTHCGHIHIGKEAPKACPVCLHPQGYFLDFKNSLFE
ncbi:rubrerythrin family protein [Clostridioides difficile]|uniref:rubrerythrin n=1 Tax=Clostridioides difficile TaxID=1496 RepID=UPI00097FDF76|nr:rubrerythrin family protein [Clostridioides difficile]EKS6835156.1 rubrerythrin family protein [Clostridioides difficile]MBZ0821061.1 rubrerythrin family protein [Clostridioides difficile]MCO5817363.1 rubrerythrin family protein [Clostridioides difficile]MDE3650466.1 rubrerythrin family protein [Clostridioides difficile]MDK3372614.1 rubrerythrin family protein [Clostridioides difficile]